MDDLVLLYVSGLRASDKLFPAGISAYGPVRIGSRLLKKLVPEPVPVCCCQRGYGMFSVFFHGSSCL